jgi:hypothetical protein
MKELIMMDSSEEERINLSKMCIFDLKEKKNNSLIHKMASLWVKYDKENFGVIEYLAELLEQEEWGLAEEYYTLCRNHLNMQQVNLWKKHPKIIQNKSLLEKWDK